MTDTKSAPQDWQIDNDAITLPSNTIPLSAITATRIQRARKWPTDAFVCIAIGVANLAIIPLMPEISPVSTAVLTVILVAIGLFMGLRSKPLYTLLLTTLQGDIVAAQDTDQAHIEALRQTLDQARQKR